MSEKMIELLISEIREIRKDVKSLLAFRNRITGMIIGVSAIVSFLVTYGIKLIP